MTQWPSIPTKPPHGSRARYSDWWCRCARCRAANATAYRDWLAAAQAETGLHARAHGLPWTPEDDAVLTDPSIGTLRARALRLGRTICACQNRLRSIREATKTQ